MKTLLSIVAMTILLSTTHALTIVGVRNFLGARTSIWWVINTWVYANDIAVAAGFATTQPLFTKNPSAIFLTGNNNTNINARAASHGATQFLYQVQ